MTTIILFKWQPYIRPTIHRQPRDNSRRQIWHQELIVLHIDKLNQSSYTKEIIDTFFMFCKNGWLNTCWVTVYLLFIHYSDIQLVGAHKFYTDKTVVKSLGILILQIVLHFINQISTFDARVAETVFISISRILQNVCTNKWLVDLCLVSVSSNNSLTS